MPWLPQMTGKPGADRTSVEEGIEELMRRYQEADSEAASLLVARLSPQLFRFFLMQAGDRSRAEDLLQDLWLRIHKARHTYRFGEPLLPWLYAIARRVQVDDYRRKSRVTKHEFQSEQLPEAADASSGGSAALEMADLLENLPEAQREMIVMLKVAGLSLEEVARATGTSTGAVKQRAHRAYKTLRQMLTPKGGKISKEF
ncbi:MAG: RNA polymerase sigma factor [Acidobacteriota bacterium]|nr:RNA polymerase sigma factor [Acidobacteriota bacterium]